MATTGAGFGICGHKNAYNAGVRQGNWVEDLMGADMAAEKAQQTAKANQLKSEGIPGRVVASESKAKYIDPRDMDQRQAMRDVQSSGEASVSTKGVPYSIMFYHTPGGEKHPETVSRLVGVSHLLRRFTFVHPCKEMRHWCTILLFSHPSQLCTFC